jgi:hypothetical protein
MVDPLDVVQPAELSSKAFHEQQKSLRQQAAAGSNFE